MPKFVLWSITMMTLRCLRAPSVLGSSGRSSSQPGMSMTTAFSEPCPAVLAYRILTCCPAEGLSTSSSAFAGPVSQSQLMLLSCSPFPLESFWKRSSRPGSSPPSATPGVSTPAGSISRSTWSSLLWPMSGSSPHTLVMYVPSGFLRSSSARDRGSIDRLGPVPAALFQPAVRFQFRIPE